MIGLSYTDAKARKNYAGTSPVTRKSGKRKTVLARWVHNDRLVDASACKPSAPYAPRPAPAPTTTSNAPAAPGTAALRQLGNRLVGILHGCLKTGTTYNETQAWLHHQKISPLPLDTKTTWDVHRSFQEYFYARKFFRWELDSAGTGQFPVVHTPVWQFIAQMALRRWDEQKARHWIAPRVSHDQDPSLTGTTLRAAAAYWLLKNRCLDFPLTGIMLDSVDLTELDLAGVSPFS